MAKRQYYTAHFRNQVAIEASKLPNKVVAEKYNIPRGTVSKWAWDYRNKTKSSKSEPITQPPYSQADLHLILSKLHECISAVQAMLDKHK